MSLSSAEFLLIVLEESEEQLMVDAIAKAGLFCAKSFGRGIYLFRPHFYGPFAPEVESAMGLLVELGFVSEDQRKVGISERIRYDYDLTEDGVRLSGSLANANPTIAGNIKDAVSRIAASGELDYNQLSLAAKVEHILAAEGRSMTAQDISQRASELGWQFGAQNVMPIAKFLQSLGSRKVHKDEFVNVAGFARWPRLRAAWKQQCESFPLYGRDNSEPTQGATV